jgi:hypothetical protein
MNLDMEKIVTGIAVGALDLALGEIKEIIKNRNKSKAKNVRAERNKSWFKWKILQTKKLKK